MMNKNIIDLTQIEKTLSNIDVTLSKKNTEYKVVIPQLEEIEKSLNDVKQIVIQNDKPIQMEYINKPTYLDYLTSFGTIGAVILSLFLFFGNNRDKRKSFCKIENFNINQERTILSFVGGEKYECDPINIIYDYIRFKIFNKCTFTKLKIKTITIDFFNNLTGDIFSKKYDKQINLYSEDFVTVSLILKYKDESSTSSLQSFFDLSLKYARDNNVQLQLSNKPKLIISTNWGEFCIYPSRKAKRLIKQEFNDFMEKMNITNCK